MAQLANTYDRYDLDTSGTTTIRDVDKMIYNIDPEETPFVSNIGSGTAKNSYREWEIDSYAAVNTSNAQIDGDEFANDSTTSPPVIGNYCQISWKVLEVTRRADAVDKYAMKEALAYELLKKGVELKRDIEAIACGYGGQQAAVAGSSSVAGKTASLGYWLKTSGNVSRGATGASGALSNTTYGYPSSGYADGTVRALSVATLKTVLTSIYTNSRKANMLMVGPTMKGRLSTFLFGSTAAIATPYQPISNNQVSGVHAVGTVDVYVDDHGVLDIVENRFQRERDVFALNTKDWRIDYLTKFQTGDIARTGDARRKSIIADWVLVSKNEKGSGGVFDIDSTAAVTA